MNNIKVYIVILNYKGWEDTIECLESVFNLNYLNFQVIVVDNSPTLESINKIKEWASGESYINIKTDFKNLISPSVKKPLDYIIISEDDSKINKYNHSLIVIKAKKNLGFSSGNNIGIKYALRIDDFKYCWLLNNDTVIEKESLINKIDYIEKRKNKKIGILGSKLLYYNNPDKIQAVGGKFNTTFLMSSHVGEGMSSTVKKEKFPTIDYVVGASMFVSNIFLKDVGLLSEDYFLYYEELDWIYRSKNKSWIIDWCENSIVYHKEGGSIGSSNIYKNRSEFSEINIFKSRKIFYNKKYVKKNLFKVASILIILNRIKRFQFRLAIKFIKILVLD